jgi:hypothetical protein
MKPETVQEYLSRGGKMESREIKTEADARMLADDLIASMGNGWLVELKRNTRTSLQNACLHRWLDEQAKRLNHAGYGVLDTLKALMKNGFDIPWTTISVKDLLYRPVMKAMTGKSSTSEMDTVEPSEICKVVGYKVSEATGITSPEWPDRFNGGARSE